MSVLFLAIVVLGCGKWLCFACMSKLFVFFVCWNLWHFCFHPNAMVASRVQFVKLHSKNKWHSTIQKQHLSLKRSCMLMNNPLNHCHKYEAPHSVKSINIQYKEMRPSTIVRFTRCVHKAKNKTWSVFDTVRKKWCDANVEMILFSLQVCIWVHWLCQGVLKEDPNDGHKEVKENNPFIGWYKSPSKRKKWTKRKRKEWQILLSV